MPKKLKYNSVDVFKTKKLSTIEKKYCSCIIKVLSKKIKNPYGICTKSVYGSRSLKRTKRIKCSQYYDFSKYPVKLLKKYAKMKKFKGIEKLKKKELLQILENYQKKTFLKKKV